MIGERQERVAALEALEGDLGKHLALLGKRDLL